jgi:hypothetical protein
MMGPRQVEKAALFYSFSLESHVPQDHILRAIDRFVTLGDLRRPLAPFYNETGRPSIDPELMIRMLIVGYCVGIRSERAYARRCTSISHIGGSAASGWMVTCLITRPCRRTGTVSFVIATCCVDCSRRE